MMRNPTVPEIADSDVEDEHLSMLSSGHKNSGDVCSIAWTDPETPTKSYLTESKKIALRARESKCQYRLAILSVLPRLRVLDGEKISDEVRTNLK